jgi:hypothetical protein
MNAKRTALLQSILLLALMLGLLARPAPALAALGILGVQPSTVSSNTSVDLVVTGTDFVDGAVVILENFGALTTSFVSATVLRAELPAGIAPGVYTVTVVNPDSSSASLPNALTVVEPTPTHEPTATATPPGDATPTPSTRPLLVIDSYGTNVDKILAGTKFNLSIKLENLGGRAATNIVAVFTPGDFIPRESGGVLAVAEIDAGDKQKFVQPLTASSEIAGKDIATLVMTVNYTDSGGAAYTETFNVVLPVSAPSYVAGPSSTPTPTSTSAAIQRPQLVITGYGTDVSQLQPGSRFTLDMQVQNLGNQVAKRVTLILGGGGSSGSGAEGTPTVGGVSGASGDFGNFAPVAASNVQYLGDIANGSSYNASAALIVNATTNPGAYPMKISFVYVDEKGNQFNDDQVVTLLVYSPPQLDVNFYRQPDPLFAGQPGLLPLQVVNLGRKSAVLGNMRVTGEGAQFENNTILVGALDIGGYYTLDTTVIPEAPGPLTLNVTIDYTDDFNQAQTVSRTLTVDVQEMLAPEPFPGEGGIDGGGEPLPEVQPETFWQKAWRFVRGLLGLDSGLPTPTPGEFPPGEAPQEAPPINVPLGGGPKG